MSTGGNVPTQGVALDEATTKKKRGDRGILGKGTPGKRLKAQWHTARASKEGPYKGPLREYVKRLAKYNGTEPELVLLAMDANEWLRVKAHPPKRVPKPKMEKAVETKGSISVPKKAAGRR